MTPKNTASAETMRDVFSGLLIGREAVLDAAKTLPRHGAAGFDAHCLEATRAAAASLPRAATQHCLGIPAGFLAVLAGARGESKQESRWSTLGPPASTV